MKKRILRALPPQLQIATKKAAHELAKETYARERDALATTVLEAHRRGENALAALGKAVQERLFRLP